MPWREFYVVHKEEREGKWGMSNWQVRLDKVHSESKTYQPWGQGWGNAISSGERKGERRRNHHLTANPARIPNCVRACTGVEGIRGKGECYRLSRGGREDSS